MPDSITGDLQQMQLNAASPDGTDSDAAMQDIIEQLIQIQANPGPAPAVQTSSADTSSLVIMKSLMSAPSTGKVQLQLLRTQQPAGADTDNQLRTEFNSRWGRSAASSKHAYIKDIFIILQNSPEAKRHVAAHQAYKKRVEARVHGNVEAYNFHGTTRACNVGENTNETSPCFKNNCALCMLHHAYLLPKEVRRYGHYGKGFYTAPDPVKASTYARNVNKKNKLHAILICSVVVGRKEHLHRKYPNRIAPRKGYDSVEGDKSVTGAVECIVYSEAAILPHALIVWSDTPVTPSIPSSPSSRTQTPVNQGIYTITNAMFPKVLDMSKLNNSRVWGFKPLKGENQSWIFEQQSGGWVIHNLVRPDLYLGLANRRNQSKGSELAMVQYGLRVVWKVMAAMNGSVRIGLNNSPSMEIDLDRRNGAQDRTHVTIWPHVRNAGQQRWYLKFVGMHSSSSGTQSLVQSRMMVPVSFAAVDGQSSTSVTSESTPHPPSFIPPHGPVQIVNKRFRLTLDLDRSSDHVVGWSSHGGANQQWIFERNGGGYVIKSAHNQQKYLGLDPQTRTWGSRLVGVDYADSVTWVLQAGVGGTVRIACEDDISMNLDMSTFDNGSDGSLVVLFSHTQNAEQQRWELV